jgi:archaemetzincin
MRFAAAAPIALQPFGDVPPDELERAARILDQRFAARSVVLDSLSIPPAAFAADRRQFDADVLLDVLFERRPERALRVVGVTEHDLYVSGRTFVFGYAHLTDGMAVYSLARLRERFYGRARADETATLGGRVERALAHELGHTFGVPHCEARGCVMGVVTQLDSLDALELHYCDACGGRVCDGLRVPPWSAEGRWERGLALFRRREYSRAVEELEHAVRCAPLETRFRQALQLARLAEAGAPSANARASKAGAQV